MTTADIITELLCRVDDMMRDARKHSQAALYPSEVVTFTVVRPFRTWWMAWQERL